MRCPKCNVLVNSVTVRVTDTRESGKFIRRRRRCVCGHSFTTVESIVDGMNGNSTRKSILSTARTQFILDMPATLRPHGNVNGTFTLGGRLRNVKNVMEI